MKTVFPFRPSVGLVWILVSACALPLFTTTATPQPRAEPTRTPFVGDTPIPVDDELPDLAYSYYSIHYDDCPWGGPGDIKVRVNNLGAGDAGEFEVRINGMIAQVNGISAGGYADAVVRFEAGPIGHVEIEIDPLDQVIESDEANNRFAIVFTPPPPCLTETP